VGAQQLHERLERASTDNDVAVVLRFFGCGIDRSCGTS